MEVIDYFDTERKQHWLEELSRCDWGAGIFLRDLLAEDKLQKFVGNVKVLMLVEGDELISFCTYADKDDIQPTDLRPWMGWVYTYPERRGRHYVGLLFY